MIPLIIDRGEEKNASETKTMQNKKPTINLCGMVEFVKLCKIAVQLKWRPLPQLLKQTRLLQLLKQTRRKLQQEGKKAHANKKG